MIYTGIESVQFYNQLRPCGFEAGVTLKGDWKNEKAVYDFIREKIIPSDKEMIVPVQVHGADLSVMNTNVIPNSPEVDGVISNQNELCLTVTTADCIPMLLADPVSGFFGAIHIGWRSYVAGIVENVFNNLKRLDVKMGDLRVILGPSIGPCCFEVHGEVAALFDKSVVRQRDRKLYVDLPEAVRNKILSYGVVNGNTESNMECTSCRTQRYYSFRRDKETTVQLVSFIYRLD